MKIENQIAQAVTAALKALYGIEAAPETLGIQKTKKNLRGILRLWYSRSSKHHIKLPKQLRPR